MICGRGNTPDGKTKRIGPFLDLERSVNWDDSTYLCQDCGEEIGQAFGMPTPDELLALRQEVRGLTVALHEEKAKRRVPVTAK
jgi:hypothetical protein